MRRRSMWGLMPVLASAAALALVGCATSPTSNGATAGAAKPRSAAMPSTPIEFGDFAKADANAVMQRFSSQIRGRYPLGASLSAISADLRKNGFACAPGAASRGDPPDQVCKRRQRIQSCGYTWQVFLYDDTGAQSLSRVRALYDKDCGDALLGGPA